MQSLNLTGPIAANPRTLVRTISEQSDWFVPLRSFPQRQAFQTLVLPPNGQVGAVPDELWLFVDRAAVDRSPHALGFGSGMSGVDVAAAMNPAWRVLHVNPGSPDHVVLELTPFVHNHFAQLARAIPLERTLDELGSRTLNALVEHPELFIVLDSSGPVGLSAQGGCVAHGVLVFTSVDAIDGLMERVPAQNRANLQMNFLTGRALFSKIGKAGFDGVLVNPFGPRGTVVFAEDDYIDLITLAEQRSAG